MTTPPTRGSMSWSARLLLALLLILAGAAIAAWALARFDGAARFLGVTPVVAPAPAPAPRPVQPVLAAPPAAAAPATANPAQIAQLEARLVRLESATQQVAGSAGRADALLVAFAARRAIDRGVALGYLETLLVDRFGATHPNAVATIVTASHAPVRLDQLIAEYEQLGPDLRSRGPNDSWWTAFTREFGSLVEIRHSEQPSTKPDARFDRALQRLASGAVDEALAETMRMPGASRAGPWVAKARRYVAAHRALDELESAALLSGGGGARAN